MLDVQTRFALIENYNNYAEGLDSKNWPLVRSCFAEQVCIDYGNIDITGVAAGTARVSDDWVKHLQSVINGFDITQHMITNHRFGMDGDTPFCRAYMSADHVIFDDPTNTELTPAEQCRVVGQYTNYYVLEGGAWRIFRSQLEPRFSSGNAGLFPVAIARAADQS
jgi:hypothetical protein